MVPDAALSEKPGMAFITVPLEIVPLDRPLPYSLYVKIGETPILFRKAGDTMTAVRADSLRAQSVSAVQVREDEWTGMLSELEKNHESAAKDASATDEDLALAARSLAMLYWREVERTRDLTTHYLEKLKYLSSNLADVIAREPKVIPSLLQRYKEPNLYFLSHTVNVTVFAIAIGHHQKIGTKELRKLATAVLLHNVGNVLIPPELLYAPRRLSEEETQIVRSHVDLGASLLASRGATDETVLTALQHHESFDGSGYPHQSKGEEIHPFARICRIADTYDALLSPRPHATPASPTETIRKMIQMKGRFDPKILKAAARGKRGRK